MSVEFRAAAAYDNLVCWDTLGNRRIELSRRLFSKRDWKSIVWHEVGHAVLMSGRRFLDEGWAVWCQYSSKEYTYFPVSIDREGQFVVPDRIAELPLSGLLTNVGTDLYFSEIVENEGEWVGVYIRAYRLIRNLASVVGLAAVGNLFDGIFEGGDAVELLEQLMEMSIGALET